ncbi:MAG TPA: hypothetical protein DEG17_10675 [Cyanobacteria bacterium UBA11149]|nr:hypothetical protein [Cyanobacteria bacterium UBA11367]HBE57474.1 hypothetical protein [Cyanobacteria bacterium UBA11366]HBK62615.1 hypothetical protein [Cyanobacteria bacterium UBA11166]HBR75781.1 hypothetical protein [Cyanobacteria bacterium UBA11159]HBS69906.1 hypothetical protein [Cyanobacteria bacterium UBA11153]HBW89314.1 hypothetical protein [Cyanobacteria bacterium UBA11149]
MFDWEDCFDRKGKLLKHFLGIPFLNIQQEREHPLLAKILESRHSFHPPQPPLLKGGARI